MEFLLAEQKTWDDIWALPIATLIAGFLAIVGALVLAKAGFKNAMNQQQDQYFKSMRLELEKSQQESERRRVFLLARYYARFFNLQTNFVLLHGMTEIAKVENPKELQDERLKVTVRFQSQWSQIKLIEFDDKRNRALDRAILLIGLFNDKDENNIRQKKVDFAGRLHAKMLKPIAKSLHEQFKGVQVQVTPVESKVKDEESWLDTILFWR